MNYFTINFTEDGDVYVSKMSKEGLEQKLSEEKHEFITEIKETLWDDSIRGAKMIIIKGELVSPQLVKIIEGYKID